MEPQNNLIEPTNRKNRIIVLILTVLLTAGAVGGGVFYTLNQLIKKQNEQIEALQKKDSIKKENDDSNEQLRSSVIDRLYKLK